MIVFLKYAQGIIITGDFLLFLNFTPMYLFVLRDIQIVPPIVLLGTMAFWDHMEKTVRFSFFTDRSPQRELNVRVF
jgi:hypothetical protein